MTVAKFLLYKGVGLGGTRERGFTYNQEMVKVTGIDKFRDREEIQNLKHRFKPFFGRDESIPNDIKEVKRNNSDRYEVKL